MKETKFKPTEIGMIPEDWEVTTLSKVCHIFGRIGFRGYTIADIVTPNNGAISISPTNIVNGKMDYSKCTYISWYKYEESEEMIGYDRKPAVNLEFLDGYYADINGRKMPIISMWISIGFVFWIMILFIGYIVYTKKYKLILAYIPILSLWLTTIASPVYCEYRYIFGMFTCIPILTILMISLSNLKEDKENKQKIKEIKESKVMENKNNEEGK